MFYRDGLCFVVLLSIVVWFLECRDVLNLREGMFFRVLLFRICDKYFLNFGMCIFFFKVRRIFFLRICNKDIM